MALPVWTADTTHFTVDGINNHTADGWHHHSGDGGDYSGAQINLKVLRADDDVLMRAIKEFVRLEA